MKDRKQGKKSNARSHRERIQQLRAEEARILELIRQATLVALVNGAMIASLQETLDSQRRTLAGLGFGNNLPRVEKDCLVAPMLRNVLEDTSARRDEAGRFVSNMLAMEGGMGSAEEVAAEDVIMDGDAQGEPFVGDGQAAAVAEVSVQARGEGVHIGQCAAAETRESDHEEKDRSANEADADIEKTA